MQERRSDEKRKRKTIMIDSELVDTVKDIARVHGMTLASYLRALFTVVAEAERNGFFAPMLINKMMLLARAKRAGLTLVPVDLLNHISTSRDEVLKIGEQLGSLLRSLGLSLEEALDLLLEGSTNVIKEHNRYIILAPRSRADEVLEALAEGIAQAYDVRPEGSDHVKIIPLTRPNEAYRP